MITRDEAIRRIEDSKESHLSWIAWYDLHPADETKHAEFSGDRKFHVEQVAKYDGVLELLRALDTGIVA